MKSKNHIKSDKPLRGLGKLGYTEGGKVHSTVKRIAALEPDNKHGSAKMQKERCPYCGRKVTVKNGKFTPHNPNRFSFKNHSGFTFGSGYSTNKDCVGSKTHVDMRELITEQLTEHTSAVNGVTVKVGDTVNVNLNGSIQHPYQYDVIKELAKFAGDKLFNFADKR